MKVKMNLSRKSLRSGFTAALVAVLGLTGSALAC